MEGELERLVAELEARNVELTARNAELERFTYTVSHDLKSPLVTIKGFAGLVEADAAIGDVERLRHDIRQIVEAADRMGQLLDDLLQLSRVGRIVNPAEPVDLTAVAHDAGKLVAGRIEERNVELEVQDDMPTVLADRVRLLEVYQNLIDNAVKFMGDQASPKVEIGAAVRGRDVVGFVRDNGTGIPAAHRERVFDLFVRLDESVEGTGIGLALVRRIVEVHGGVAWVESNDDLAGSTFFFTLPERLAEPALGGANHREVAAQSVEYQRE